MLKIVTASPGDLDALKSRPTQQAARLLRIRAGMLAAEGRFAEFAATAGEIIEIDADQAEDLYELGRSLARCAGYLDHNTAAPAPAQELQTLRQRLADRAVAVLVRAVEHGLRNPRRLDVDVVLASVRQHPGFRQLAERLAAPDPSNKPAAASRSRRN